MSLNASQRAAVEHEQGPLLVLAGAGSGKTRVITHRIARLIDRGVRPEAILAVSFTNKAAAEMVERLERLTGKKAASTVWMSTFHSFGVRFLSEEKHAFGGDGRFVIFDQGDSLGIVRDVMRRERGGERKLDAAAILARISLWKNAFLAPDEVPERDFEYDAIAREVYPRYESTLRSMRAVDFDDLVVLPVRVLRDRPDVRDKWQHRFRHVLVDEFQDTNKAQLELVRGLVGGLRNVCVVGDDDQSIYGWRGAEVGNILDFEQHFPGAKIVKLEDNYRSRAQILAVANHAIARSTMKRHGKVLRPTRGDGDRVRLGALSDAVAESKAVAREIRALASEGRRYHDMAVLYRSNLSARLIEEELRVQGVPYRLFGGTQYFDRKEIKDAIAYLRVVVHPDDELSLRRILNNPPRGIGDTTVRRLEQHALVRGVPFARALADIDGLSDVPDGAKRGAAKLCASLAEARRRLGASDPPSAVAKDLFAEAGIDEDIRSEGGTVGARRQENLKFLLRSIERFERDAARSKTSLGTFLTRITLRIDDEEESDPGNRVTLSTLHAAKGLEFGVVFLIGCVEGQLPHSRTTDPKVTEAAPTDVEEERRLFYVGVTRARDRLYITRPLRKSMRGKVLPQTPSRFLDELPDDAIEHWTPADEPAVDHDEAADYARAILEQLQGGG